MGTSTGSDMLAFSFQIPMPLSRGILVFWGIPEFEGSAKVALKRLANPGNQVFRCGRNNNLAFVFAGVDDSLQRMCFGGLPRNIFNTIQDFLPVILDKTARAFYCAANLFISNLNTRRAKLPVQLMFGIQFPALPNAVLKNQIAFRAFGISLIFFRLKGAAQLASLFRPEYFARSICVTHHSSFGMLPLPVSMLNLTTCSPGRTLLSSLIFRGEKQLPAFQGLKSSAH
jgi:hypothetical protein